MAKKLIPKQNVMWHLISYVDDLEITRYFGWNYETQQYHWSPSIRHAIWSYHPIAVDESNRTIYLCNGMYPVKYDAEIKKIFFHEMNVNLEQDQTKGKQNDQPTAN